MEQAKLDRINALARASRLRSLTPSEREEQQALRLEYRRAVVGNLKQQLRQTVIIHPDGSETPVRSKALSE